MLAQGALTIAIGVGAGLRGSAASTKVQELDMWTNKDDPVMTCQPLGNPRQGPPRRIVQSANDIIFFYTQYADGGGGNNEFHIIPTDGRKHDEKKAIEATYYGYTISKSMV